MHVRSGLTVEEYRTIIYRVEGSHIVMQLPPRLSLREGQQVTLYKETDGGDPQEYITVIQSARYDPEEEVDVIYGTIPEGFRTRQYFREETTLQVDLYVEEGQKPDTGNMFDLSGNGMRLIVELRDPERPKKGDIVQVQFSLPRMGGSSRLGGRRSYASEPQMDEFKLAAQVIRRHTGTERRLTVLGIMFDDVQFVGSADAEEMREALIRYVLQLEVQRRAARNE